MQWQDYSLSLENSDFKSYFRSELTFQKVKKGLTDNIAEEQEGTSGEEDIVHEDDVFM